MAVSSPAPLGAVIVDIEGTIASIHFVKARLFPYAAERYQAYFAGLDMSQQANIQEALFDSPFFTGEELGSAEGVAAVLREWTAKDYKDTTLKDIQGQIWRQGYEAGELKAPLYADAMALFQRCRDGGLPLYSYSSGSVAAQKLFYQYNEAGDLRPYFSGYFDTTIGGKKDASSYQAIAAAIGLEPATIAFYSDSPAEISAAAKAGWQARLVSREPDGGPLTDSSGPAPLGVPVIASFSGELV